MGLKEFDYQGYNANRSTLGKVLPLPMPYTVQINISNICNFKCYYCIKSKSEAEQRSVKVYSRLMSFDKYTKIIDNIADSGHLKMLLLQGWGEPLLHKDICEMIAYAKKKKVADTVRIITNGSLLTHEMSNALIQSGLDSLKISLQGLNPKAYLDTSGVKFDFSMLVSNIRYFYKHKKHTQIIIKIIDVMIKEGGTEQLFKKIFEPISDQIVIESLIPIVNSIDYSRYDIDNSKNILNQNVLYSDICTSPFMRLHVDVDGFAVPCCAVPVPFQIGDAASESFKSIWNGVRHRELLMGFLKGEKKKIPVCKDCTQYIYGIIPCEVLDEYRDELIEKYERIGG